MSFTLCAFADEVGSDLHSQIAALVDNGISLLEVRGVNGQNFIGLSVKQAKELNE